MSILHIRKRWVRLDSTLALCTMLLGLVYFTGCDAAGPDAPGASDARAAAPVVQIDGESLFRGIFFGEGAVPEMVPELQSTFSWKRGLSQGERVALDEFVDALVKAIHATDATFFDTFAAEMRSGDHLRIQKVLDRTNEVTVAALPQVPQVATWRAQLAENSEAAQTELVRLYNQGKINQDQYEAYRAQLALAASGDFESMEAKAGWAFAVAIALALVLAYPTPVAVAVAVVVAYAWVTAAPADGNGELQREQVIHTLATRLAI